MHIGLIGGIGPAATEFYYRGLVRAHDRALGELELTIAHADLDTQLANLTAGKPEAQAEHFRRHGEQLKSAGADLMAITSIAGHFCVRELEAIAPLPVANALPAIRSGLAARGISRVGLIGTGAAIESRLYGALGDIEVVVPPGEEGTTVGERYVAMAIAQHATPADRELFFAAGARMCSEQGAEAVLLGGTDLFLAFEGESPGFPVIDSAELHIEELARLAAQGRTA